MATILKHVGVDGQTISFNDILINIQSNHMANIKRLMIIKLANEHNQLDYDEYENNQF